MEEKDIVKFEPLGARVVVVGGGGAKQDKTIPTQQINRKPVPFIISVSNFILSTIYQIYRPILKVAILVLISEQ